MIDQNIVISVPRNEASHDRRSEEWLQYTAFNPGLNGIVAHHVTADSSSPELL
jgi:hypothetical protein